MKPSSCRILAFRLAQIRTKLPAEGSRCLVTKAVASTPSTHATAAASTACTSSSSTMALDSVKSSSLTKPASFSTAMQEVDYYDDDDDDDYGESIEERPQIIRASSVSAMNTTSRRSVQNGHTNFFRKQSRPFKNSSAPAVTKTINSQPFETQREEQPQQQVSECTCGFQKKIDVEKDNLGPLPPPLPQPMYSVHKRVLPPNLVAMSSPQGRQWLLESLTQNTAESYWALTEQFVNQGDPAFCGVTTLLMVLNAVNIDPNTRWKGGWRFYGDENVLLNRCCLNTERIRRSGITMEQFMILGTCHGMRISMKRPIMLEEDKNEGSNDIATEVVQQFYTLDDFRSDLSDTLDSRNNNQNAMLVTSFSRSALNQTGDGHFSPIAAYHQESDQVLILDVARFKYAPYWVSVPDLFKAMQPLDEVTKLPRGWYVMKPPSSAGAYHEMSGEDRRPAHLVPQVHEAEHCPVGKIKVQFCPAKANGSSANGEGGKAPKELQ